MLLSTSNGGFNRWNAMTPKWTLGQVHEIYGKVVMMGTIWGEPYRWFKSAQGTISMIPLSSLVEQIQGPK